jgi:hypothetical protein
MGIKPDSGVSVRFKSISEDPAFRTLQGLGTALQNGGINQAEYRAGVLALMDIKPTEDALPTPNAFTGAKTIKPDYPVDAQLEIAHIQIDSTEKLAKQANDNALKVAAATPAPTPPAGAPKAKKPANRSNPNPSQGNTGTQGKMSDGDNTNRDASHKPGTGNSK